MSDSKPEVIPRSIRSFVTRNGRITEAQQRALDELWPSYGVEVAGGALDLAAVFDRSAPLTMEIGFGNGDNLLCLAAAHPERNYLGVEVHLPGIGRLLLALQTCGLTNVRVVCRDAVEVLGEQLPPDCINELLILFPDPWPKKRHHKRRLVQPPFVELAVSRLTVDGVLRLATDWEPYAQEMLSTLAANPRLRNAAPEGGFIPRPQERPVTRFERRGERLGHGVRDLAFRRIS
jgi:tRNA (guanine-N7-)-methyltransferase